ncbi:MAG: hybrid sensor histidine kinase/response regulator, partial [Burkholderiales bacterium]
YEVARRLRRLPGVERALLIALTGYGRDQDRQRARAAGFDRHLTKPVDLSTLNALLADHATGSSSPPRGPSRSNSLSARE